MIRPEDVSLSADHLMGDIVLRGTVEDTVYLGAHVRYRLTLPDGQRLVVTSTDRGLRRKLAVGKPAWCGWSIEAQRVIEDQ